MAAGSAASGQVEQFRLEGTLDRGQLGEAVARTADLDGDGRDDWMVAESHYDAVGNEGRVLVFSGATATPIRTHVGAPGDFLGSRIVGLGDVDGDAVPDYAISANGHAVGTKSFVGRVEAYSGATGLLLWGTDGVDSYDSFGRRLWTIGDLDGDGADDLTVAHLDGLDEIEILSGATGARLLQLVTPNDFIDSCAVVSDLDGDGRRDFALGFSWAWIHASREGLVVFYSGATGAQITTLSGAGANDHLGLALAATDDIDQDGVDDFLVSAGTFGTDGRVELRSGATFAVLRTIAGSGGELLGFTLAAGGDWDGDGVGEYFAAAPNAGTFGVVRVYAGGTGALLHEFVAEDATGSHDKYFGERLATGDWNGDGIGDLLIPAWGWYGNTGVDRGIVHVYLGCPASQSSYGAGFPGTLGTPTLSISGDPELGATLTFAADNSLGAATTGWVLIGDAAASIPLRKGGTLLALPQIVIAVPIDATGFRQDEQLPDDPALGFEEFFLQVVLLDPGAAGGLAMTQGLRLQLGWDY